jgi:predicted nucleic acid-binding protein
MVMVKGLFDTNILIDYLNGIAQAEAELDRYHYKAISVISWMEVMAGATELREQAELRMWMRAFTVIGLDGPIAESAVLLRRQRRIRLPDAIIWATAQVHSLLLVSRNTKDFPPDEPGVRMPYRLPGGEPA